MVITGEGMITYYIYNKLFDETYTAYIQKNGKSWEGTIAELPEIEYAAETAEAVQQKLPDMIEQTLIAKEEAWDQQIKEDMEAGRLDNLIEKAREDYKAGRCTKFVQV